MNTRRCQAPWPDARSGRRAVVLVLLGLTVSAGACSKRSERDAGSPAWRPPAPRAATARLDGDVRFTGTQFVIENRGDAMWRDVSVQVYREGAETAYTFRADAVLGRRSLTIGALHFAGPDGSRLSPFRVAPRTFAVTARLPDGTLGFTSGVIAEIAPP